MADLGGYEGVRQVSLSGLPDLPGRPIRQSGGGLCPPVLHRTEADGGVSSHPAPAVCCCLHPTTGCSPSVCSSLRAPSCCLHLENLLFPFVLFRHWPPGQWYPKLQKKSSFLFLRVPRGRGWQCTRPRLHTPIPLSLRQWAAGSGPRTRCLLPRPLPSHGAR